jgi:hypothetical protein
VKFVCLSCSLLDKPNGVWAFGKAYETRYRWMGKGKEEGGKIRRRRKEEGGRRKEVVGRRKEEGGRWKEGSGGVRRGQEGSGAGGKRESERNIPALTNYS